MAVATFETKSSYCRVAGQGLPCYTAVAQLGFKRRAIAVLKSNLIRSIEFGTAVALSTFETGLRLHFRFHFDITEK